ncbi:hypothetical protein Tco_0458535 [Tanacetum coccineum]
MSIWKLRNKEVYGLDAGIEYDPSNVDFGEWLASKFSNHMTMDWYTKNALWIYLTRGDDKEVITDDELSNLGDGNLIEEIEIDQIFMIDANIFHFETPLCEAFKEFNYLLKIDVDIMDLGWKPSDDIEHICKPFCFKNGHAKWPTYEWYENLEECELKDEALNSKAIFEGSKGVDEEPRTNNDYETQENDGWFDEQEIMGDDDDDMDDLKDYLIQKNPPYYVNKEEERSKEKNSCWYSYAFTTHILAYIRNMEDHIEQISGEFSVLVL